jgi:hypothetical protein
MAQYRRLVHQEMELVDSMLVKLSLPYLGYLRDYGAAHPRVRILKSLIQFRQVTRIEPWDGRVLPRH